MTDDHTTDNPSPTLPGDVIDKTGRRNRTSRWAGVKLKVEVNEQDIDLSVRGVSNHCMIADAIKRQRPNVTHVSVDQFTARWTDLKKHVRYTFLLPEPARKRLIYFDQGAKPKPFSFWLTGPKITQTDKDVRENGRIKERMELGIEKPSSIHLTATRGLESAYAKDRIIGGKPQPLHRKSSGSKRRFGARAFTWDETDVVPYDPTL